MKSKTIHRLVSPPDSLQKFSLVGFSLIGAALLISLNLWSSRPADAQEGRPGAAGLSATGLSAAGPSADVSPEDVLIVFAPPKAVPLGARFFEESLPGIREAAAQAGVSVELRDLEMGVPPEVRITPALIYQNHRGRSIFQGRYVNAASVRNFIRTVRRLPQGEQSESREQIAVRREGRSVVVAPLKITPLAGAMPEDHAPERFAAEARRAILAGLSRFRLEERVSLGRMDRAFYMDFYPYRGDDGRLFLSVALFSQFNCIEPIFQRFTEPLSGAWGERAAVFTRAAALLEAELERAMASSELGDGFVPVSSAVQAAEWAALGLALPPAPQGASRAVAADLELPVRWRIAERDEASEAAPGIQFRFPPPLDRYAGEVESFTGELLLGPGGSLADAEGWVLAEMATITLGYPALDNAVRGKILKTIEYPKARFELGGARGEVPPMAFGKGSQFVADGSFELMGSRIPMEVRAQIEPGLDGDGRPVLWVQATSRLRLGSPFGIEGPDGPELARDTVELFLDFEMVPAL